MSKLPKLNYTRLGMAGQILASCFNIIFNSKVEVPHINRGESGSPGSNGYVSVSW